MCDDLGWSWADCLDRRDDGAQTTLGAAAPNAAMLLPTNGGGAPTEARRAKRRKRLKESHSYLVMHISNPEVKRILMRPPIVGK